jgi:hypothetical protein
MASIHRGMQVLGELLQWQHAVHIAVEVEEERVEVSGHGGHRLVLQMAF